MCLNANMDVINCPYSLRNFTAAILLKFTDSLGTFFSRRWKFNEICWMRWKFFTKVMGHTNSSRFRDTKCLTSTSIWVSSCRKATATRFSSGISMRNIVSCFEMFLSNKLTILTKGVRIYTKVLFKWFLEVFHVTLFP